MSAITTNVELLSERYLLEARVASGGMGTIFSARDLLSGERVAVKMLAAAAGENQVAIRRFRREAEVASELDHPGIVRVRDWGESAGVPYLVMDYADGPDLNRLLGQRGRLSEREALRIVADVARALDFAHSFGVVHRDVKPHNVVLAHDGRARLTDFGIAQMAGASRLTDDGTVLGSAHYISPEQARGDALDPRTDIYSLGIVLYELLTGRAPFEGTSPVAIAMSHLQTDPPLPRRLVPELTPDVEAIVLRAIAKEPARRYQSAGEMAEAIERALRRTPHSEPATAATQEVFTGPIAGNQPAASLDPVTIGTGRGTFQRSGWPAARWLVAIATVMLGVSFAALGWGRLSASSIPVPDIVGLSEDEARGSLRQSEISLRVDHESYTSGIEPGTILAQQPPAGEEIRRGEPVGIAVARAPQPVIVPSLVGRSESEASGLLHELGLMQGTTQQVPSDRPSLGLVTTQDPPAGEPVTAGSAVNLRIGAASVPRPADPTSVSAPAGVARSTPVPSGVQPGRGAFEREKKQPDDRERGNGRGRDR